MKTINLSEIEFLVYKSQHDTVKDSLELGIDDLYVNKSIDIIINIHPSNECEVFLHLCALNMLNAAIKTEKFKDVLSYDFIKSNATKLIGAIDGIKTDNLAYFYNKEECCLYIKFASIIFSFHHVPLTGDILKASFNAPIVWSGIRLQEIAPVLLGYALKIIDGNENLKVIMEMDNHDVENANEILSEKNDSYCMNTGNNLLNNEVNSLSDKEKTILCKNILAVITLYCTSDSEGWYNLVDVAPKFKQNGIDYSLYGFNKLITFLEYVMGNTMQRRNEGTMVYLKFPIDNSYDANAEKKTTNNVEILQNESDIFKGINLGDIVEISAYGIIKSGKINVLNHQFVQLELGDNRYVRIKHEAISSVEYKKVPNIIPIVPSFANSIVKNILISEGLYPSTTIETNATITMVESRRVWLITDDGNMGSCYKGSIIGYDKDKLVKGQRIFVFPFKKEKAYCIIMEMLYSELYESFEELILQKKDNYKRMQILSILTFLIKNVKQPESLSKARELKLQLKGLLSSTTSSPEDIFEEDSKSCDIEVDFPDETINEENVSLIEIESNQINDIESNPKNEVDDVSDIKMYKTESPYLQGPKIVGKIDLSEIWTPKKKKVSETNTIDITESSDFITINNVNDLLPSMGKIIRMSANKFGWIAPHNSEEGLYFNTAELISYAGILDAPNIGDEVIYSLGQNAQGPMAVCVHKQCTREVVEELADKFSFNAKISGLLKRHIKDFDALKSTDIVDGTDGLTYFLNKVGINSKISFSPNEVEKLFAEKLSSNEYAKAIECLIDIVVKSDPSKCYNLFLRSSSYARTHKMYDVSKHLIEKALDVFRGESGKVKYFKGLLKTIDSLSNRIEINENIMIQSLEKSKAQFPFMPTYVRDTILNYKDFNGITLDKETVRTGLYKEEYIEELKDNIKQNNADDLLYLTMIKLQLAFHPKEYNPKDDVAKFLVNRAKNILATGVENRYGDVRYLLRLAYRIKTIETGFDDTVGLYVMTLGDYTASEIDMYMNKGDRSNYKFEDLLKNINENVVNNMLELTLLAESNVSIKNRIVREYEKIGKNTNVFAEFPAIVNEVKKRYLQYSTNPTINFMSFISYLQSSSILLDNEMNIVGNDSIKIVSYVTDFNTGQRYNAIRDAYNNIIQKIDAVIPNLIDHPTEIGYETILPSLRLLKKNVSDKFKELEQRANPTIQVEILESVGLEESKSVELKVEIRNSSDSARSVHINRLNVFGDDLAEDNDINIDVALSAGECKLINIELSLCDNALEGKIAEVEFMIEYDDIYIATEQRIPMNSIICKTINFKMSPYVEINNRFRQCAGGEELESGNSMFYGRDVIINNIKQSILDGAKNQIAIYGQKRSGKSSLLNQIMGKLESDDSHSVICGKFNLQSLPEDELNPVRWILESIAKALLQGIRKHGVRTLNKTIVSNFFAGETDAFAALGDFIEHINTIDELKGSHFVIFIDEFTYLYKLIKDKDVNVNEDFMRRWIALIEMPGINLQAIVAAQDTLPHFMDESYASNCFNKFSKEPLSYLNKEEALQLIKNPIKEVVFHNHSDELIYDYTSGSAFFIQIFCMRLVDYLNSEKSNVVGKEEIEIVADRLCTGTHRLEKSTFECLTKEADGSDYNEDDNIKVLKAIAEHTRAGGHVNMEDLNVNLSQEKLKCVLDNLYARRVISKQDKGYSINVKLFVKWILNN